jgi:nucleotide-binding universal stress UspA family protein
MTTEEEMYRKILVPLDGSELAESVLPYAHELAARMDLDLAFMRVCGVLAPGPSSDCEYYLAGVAEAAKRAVQQLRARFGVSKELKTQQIVKEGYPAEEIINAAAENGADLILMATHGYSGLRGWMIGSVADKVLQKTLTPVLLVRADAPALKSYDRWLEQPVLVPLDGSKAAESVLPHLLTLAQQQGGSKMTFRLVRIVEPVMDTTDFPEAGISIDWEQLKKARADVKEAAKKYVHEIENQLKSQGLNIVSEVRMCPVSGGIIECAKGGDIGLVVMADRGVASGGYWEMGGKAGEIIHNLPGPVLAVRAGGD